MFQYLLCSMSISQSTIIGCATHLYVVGEPDWDSNSQPNTVGNCCNQVRAKGVVSYTFSRWFTYSMRKLTSSIWVIAIGFAPFSQRKEKRASMRPCLTQNQQLQLAHTYSQYRTGRATACCKYICTSIALLVSRRDIPGR